ncbi:hypothetical protein IEQ34_000249 [Dendrobium chrysotoxum]|uniref:Uncharacterized protein n=1 Tax=Dendrobium chrysotoxum TaxID=161865 RepID=A0AAV7HPA5_DENCH|nr:hypothetical protein IEQ34_000249 [Dendrobium chrysotoxum]
MGLGVGPAHAAYFSIYEISKRLLLIEDHLNNPAAHATTGIFATVASDVVFTPMDTVKQRLQMGSSPYKGFIDCVRRVLKEEGFWVFYGASGG